VLTFGSTTLGVPVHMCVESRVGKKETEGRGEGGEGKGEMRGVRGERGNERGERGDGREEGGEGRGGGGRREGGLEGGEMERSEEGR